MHRLLHIACLWLALAYAGTAHAGIGAPTRVQFSGDADDMSLTLTNQANQPSLVQSWIDTGDANADPSEIQAPFLLTPSVVRIEAGSSQSLRILFVPGGMAVAQDRESRFYLNLVDIPPVPQGEAESNAMQLAVHFRMPLIYRPKALLAAGRTADAVAGLQWRLRREGDAGVLEASNPSPFHVSLRGVSIQDAPGSADHVFDTGEILPFAKAVFRRTDGPPITQATAGAVRYVAADERGYDLHGSARVSVHDVPPSTAASENQP